MSNVFVRSVSGANVTLTDGTVVGAVPVLVSAENSAVQTAVAAGTIVEIDSQAAEILVGSSRITRGTQGTPQLLLTVQATTLTTASTWYNYNLKNVLNPLAKKRILQFGGEGANGLDNYVNVMIVPYVATDTNVTVSDPNHVRVQSMQGTSNNIANVDGSYMGIIDSSSYPNLADDSDSLFVGIQTQATLPTKGYITLRLIELT